MERTTPAEDLDCAFCCRLNVDGCKGCFLRSLISDDTLFVQFKLVLFSWFRTRFDELKMALEAVEEEHRRTWLLARYSIAKYLMDNTKYVLRGDPMLLGLIEYVNDGNLDDYDATPANQPGVKRRGKVIQDIDRSKKPRVEGHVNAKRLLSTLLLVNAKRLVGMMRMLGIVAPTCLLAHSAARITVCAKLLAVDVLEFLVIRPRSSKQLSQFQ